MKRLILLLSVIALLVLAACETVPEAPPVVEEVPEVEEVPAAPSEPAVVTPPVQEQAVVPVQPAASGQIQILGAQGFSEDTITILAGHTVEFVNQNPSETDIVKSAVIVIEDKATGFDLNSKTIQDQESYTYTFEEAGTFTVWTVGYGLKMEVVVQ